MLNKKQLGAFLKRAGYGKMLSTLVFHGLVLVCIPIVMPTFWGWVLALVFALFALASYVLFWAMGWFAEKLWGSLWTYETEKRISRGSSRGRSGR